MRHVLLFAPTFSGDAPQQNTLLPGLARHLKASGYCVASVSLDSPGSAIVETLLQAFGGRPPDVMLVDVSCASGCLPLHYARRQYQYVWGPDARFPLSLALLSPAHLEQREWLPYADDFLLPTHTPQEALARITQLAFRHRQIPSNNLLTFADLTLDMDGKRALDSQSLPLPLKPREYELLEFLIVHRGKFFSRDRLLDFVWGVEFEGYERTVDIHVSRLRSKLPPEAASRLETRRGTGYGFANVF